MKDLSEIEILSSIGEFKAFKESSIWTDFVRELEAWKLGFDNEGRSIVDNASTENPSTASVLLHMGDINGRIKAVNYMLSLPDVFISILEGQKDQPKTTEEEIDDGE